MARHASGAPRSSECHLRSYTMSDSSSSESTPVDLDAIETELAEVELMLERLNEPNNP